MELLFLLFICAPTTIIAFIILLLLFSEEVVKYFLILKIVSFIIATVLSIYFIVKVIIDKPKNIGKQVVSTLIYLGVVFLVYRNWDIENDLSVFQNLEYVVETGIRAFVMMIAANVFYTISDEHTYLEI